MIIRIYRGFLMHKKIRYFSICSYLNLFVSPIKSTFAPIKINL